MKSPSYFQPELHRRAGQRLACDLCIYGATSAGIVAAVEARARGLQVVLLAAGTHLGGLTAGGLGCTDFGHKAVIGGLARKFYQDVGAEYGLEEEWYFEPSAARRVYERWLREAGIEPLFSQYLDEVEVEGPRVRSIRLLSGLVVEAGFFLDATYEGDLMARAGVPYRTGREGNEVHGELLNGVQVREQHQFEFPVSPWRREGDPSSGLLPGISPEPLAAAGTGDGCTQAYNFRMCLTRAADRVPFRRPDGYEPARYELLARYLRDGWRDIFYKYDPIQGGKTDTNNHGAFSSDFVGENHGYPEGSFTQREAIFQAHVNYHQGLLWFYCHDERVPAEVRRAMHTWGLAADEFADTGHWPPQLYIREARRMVADYVVTELDYRGYRRADDAVGCGAYGMDSHNCQRVVVGERVLNEGDVQLGGHPPYPVSYRAVIPPRGSVANLFVPVCVSASHIAYGSVRMEPVFMVLAQSCAVAAALCRERGCTAQELPYAELRASLLAAGQVLGPVAEEPRTFGSGSRLEPPTSRVLRTPRTRRAAFTLMELLLVMAIVAVLAGLLLPVLSKMRQRSAAAGCLNNLKQIGTALNLYANEHDATYPPARDLGLSWPAAFWYYKINPYLANYQEVAANYRRISFDNVMRDPGKTDWNLNGPTDVQALSYAMNAFTTDASAVGSGAVAKKLATITEPVRTLLVTDVAYGYPVVFNGQYLYKIYTPPRYAPLRHFGQDNMLFCDGHAQAVPKFGLSNDLLLQPTPKPY